MEYTDYSKWKGWLTETPFAQITNVEYKKYKIQLDSLRIPYKNISALEIGYGNGGFLKFLLMNHCNVEGVEIQQPLIDAAKTFGVHAKNSIDDIDGNFDLIVAFDVLEHLSIVELQNLFEKCKLLLNNDGRMLFRFPNAESFAGLGAQNGDFTHITAIARSKLDQLIRPYGFQITQFDGEIEYPRKPLVNFIRGIFRYLLMKGMGVGSKHFFSTNVVTVIERTR
jgi:2-polyprenyl-3-methyl-5-hydroxy-6-metoxy-1,4-benzoquinol methylase